MTEAKAKILALRWLVGIMNNLQFSESFPELSAEDQGDVDEQLSRIRQRHERELSRLQVSEVPA